jgi:hypothetical protein
MGWFAMRESLNKQFLFHFIGARFGSNLPLPLECFYQAKKKKKKELKVLKL